jgi:hypothetical protein
MFDHLAPNPFRRRCCEKIADAVHAKRKSQIPKHQITNKFQISKIPNVWNLPFGILHTESTSTTSCRKGRRKRLNESFAEKE